MVNKCIKTGCANLDLVLHDSLHPSPSIKYYKNKFPTPDKQQVLYCFILISDTLPFDDR